ncbi:hypothetical protein [Thomasclavelia sp.]
MGLIAFLGNGRYERL